MNRASIYIIAEAGVNHNGSLEIAIKMVDAAAKSGANAVKFQTFKAENLVNKHAPKAQYQIDKTQNLGKTQYEMLKNLELTKSDHYELLEHCKKKKIEFLSTPFDLPSIELLNQMGIKTFKIPSGEITNYPYLKQIGKLKKSVILSTGMSDLNEIKNAIQILRVNGTEDIIVLHCNTEYPTPMKDANLKAIPTLRDNLQLPIGYSDHTAGITAAVAAAALGSVVIEKHFTLDRTMEGPDHKASLEPYELEQMVLQIRLVETAMGTGIKEPSDSECKNKNIARKSIVTQRKIKRGERFTEENLTTKRPGSGISPMNWDNIIGKISSRDYESDTLLSMEELHNEK